MRILITAIFSITLITSCNSEQNKSTTENLSELQSIHSPADSVSAEPYLFTDKNGLVYLSWTSKESGKSLLKYSRFENGKWATPSVIASGDNWFVNWADYSLIASNGSNHLISHFLEKSDKGKFTYDVKITTSSDNGKSWTNPLILHDDGKKAEHGFVSMVPYNESYFLSWK